MPFAHGSKAKGTQGGETILLSWEEKPSFQDHPQWLPSTRHYKTHGKKEAIVSGLRAAFNYTASAQNKHWRWEDGVGQEGVLEKAFLFFSKL